METRTDLSEGKVWMKSIYFTLTAISAKATTQSEYSVDMKMSKKSAD